MENTTTTRKKRYVIYARLSCKGDHATTQETSIPLQIEKCKDYVQFNDGEVSDVVTDEFISGKDMKRPGIQRIIAAIETDTADFDGIITYRLDRISRSTYDLIGFIKMIQKHKKSIIFLAEKIDIDTPAGNMQMQIFGVFSEFFREQSRWAIKEKMYYMASQEGKFMTGKAPFGYRRKAPKENYLVIEPLEAEIGP